MNRLIRWIPRSILVVTISALLLLSPRIAQWGMNQAIEGIERVIGVDGHLEGWHLDPLRHALVLEGIHLQDELGPVLTAKTVEIHYEGQGSDHLLIPRYRIDLQDPFIRLIQDADGHYRLGHLAWPPKKPAQQVIPFPRKVTWHRGVVHVTSDTESHALLTVLNAINGDFERDAAGDALALHLQWSHASGGTQALDLERSSATGELNVTLDLEALPLAAWKEIVPRQSLWKPLSGEISGHLNLEMKPGDAQAMRGAITDFRGDEIHLRHETTTPREYILGHLRGYHLSLDPTLHHYRAEAIEALDVTGPGFHLDRVTVPLYDSEATSRRHDADPIRIAGLSHVRTHIAELILKGLHPRDAEDLFRVDSLVIHGTEGPRINAALIEFTNVSFDPHARILKAENGQSQEIFGDFGLLTNIRAEPVRITLNDDCLALDRLQFGAGHTKTFKTHGGYADRIEWDRSRHEIRLDHVHLKNSQMAAVTMAEIEADKVRYDTPAKQLHMARLKGHLGAVSNENHTGKPALMLREIVFHQYHSDPLRSHWRANQVQVKDAQMDWVIHPDNHFELRGLSSGAGNQGSSSVSKAPKKHWTYEIGAIVLKHSEAAVTDLGTTPPTQFTLKDLDLSADDLDTRANDDTDIDAHARLGTRGSVAVSGRMARNPLRAALRIDLQRFRLPLLAPYWNAVSQLTLKRGYASINGELRIIPGEDHHFEFEGDGHIDELETHDPLSGRNVLCWKQLTLDDIAISSHPKRFYTRVMDFEEAYLHLVLKEDHHLNLADVFKVEDPALVPTEIKAMRFEPSPTLEPPHAAIGLVRFHESRVDYSDLGFKPQLSTSVRELMGTVRGLSTRRDATAEISLAGKINRHSPVRLSGSLEPMDYQDHTDLLLDFTGLNMTSFPQYAGRFSGYRVARGKLNMDLHYQVDQAIIQVENRTIIDRLTLGEKIEDADHPFVDLALWMLKDNRGNLDIDLPIYGDLENPSYELGTLYAQALAQFFGKIFTSPATLVQDLIPTTHEEQTILFEPGHREVDPKTLTALQRVIEVYKDQEGGVIEITPSANPKTDGFALADEALKLELKEAFVHEMRLAGKPVPSREDIQLSNQDLKRQFIRYFKEHHPDQSAFIPLPGDEDKQSASMLDLAWRHALEEWRTSPDLLLDLAEDRADFIRNRLVHDYDIDDSSIYLRQAEFQSENNPVPVKVEYFSD